MGISCECTKLPARHRYNYSIPLGKHRHKYFIPPDRIRSQLYQTHPTGASHDNLKPSDGHQSRMHQTSSQASVQLLYTIRQAPAQLLHTIRQVPVATVPDRSTSAGTIASNHPASTGTTAPNHPPSIGNDNSKPSGPAAWGAMAIRWSIG